MIAMWIGMPLVVIVMHFLNPVQGDFPMTLFSGIIIASIGGLLAAVILSSTMANEINANVYALFLIRPVKRWQIVIAKYIAFMFSLIIASLLSFTSGIIVDLIRSSLPSEILKALIRYSFENLLISLSAMSIACAAGLVIGMLVKSVAMAVILSIYLGQQMSVIAILPGYFLENVNPLVFSIGVGLAATVIILSLGIFVFQKKQF
jgi:ABC-type transport system involved in multi-copper enzyme maturation permease subunit